tara:strand:- start:2490 stop:2675 length:186 start_codon:yes stop_codon:yes gene_type:complete
MPKIKVREAGPYVVYGDDFVLVDAKERVIPIERQPVALCRCGASEKRPFCDGSHNRVGFKD